MSKMNLKDRKIPRNDPCPCGRTSQSGKPLKYKKCCRLSIPPPVEQEKLKKIFGEVIERKQREEAELRKRGIFINYVKPCNYTNPKTGGRVRAWALGNRLFHTRPEHETFHEFIVTHLQQDILGRDWVVDQLQADQKHFLFKCLTKWNEWTKKNATEENKVDEHVWYSEPDGWAKTLISLAFDVCSLEHTLQLPEHLLKRLRNRGEYQGAHYEIAVAAIFARLGCSIDFLDKEKHTNPHCEFIATHRETGVSIAVEAKSRQRPGVKHMGGSTDPEQLLKGDVKHLLDKALKQNPKDKPFFIFIDVNAPLTPKIQMDKKPWFMDIENMLNLYPTPTRDKPEEFTGLFFTNFSPHYDEENEPSPNEFLAVIPIFSQYPMPNSTFGNMMLKAIENYGFVPHIVEDTPTEEEAHKTHERQ